MPSLAAAVFQSGSHQGRKDKQDPLLSVESWLRLVLPIVNSVVNLSSGLGVG